MRPAENTIQKKLIKVIHESLELLKQASIAEQNPTAIDMPIPSLLEQCIELCDQHHIQTQEPIRTVHHFGLPLDSLLLSSLTSLVNTRVLTDIYPLNNSVEDNIQSQVLVAKNISTDYNSAVDNTGNDDCRVKDFLSELQQTQEQNNQIGRRLLICDNHCLSLTGKTYSDNLLTLLKRQFTLRSFIVSTDPINSYPAYCSQLPVGTPSLDFEAYCQSVLEFILENPDLTVIQHEDFMDRPREVMGEVCELLSLPVCDDFLVLGEVFVGEGQKKKCILDSQSLIELQNRSGGVNHRKLCDLLGYRIVNTIAGKNKKYQLLISDSQFTKKQTIKLSNKISQKLSKKIEWFTLPVQAGFEYYLKGAVDSDNMSNKHIIALFEFMDADGELIEDESVSLDRSEIGYYQYIRINKTGLSDFLLSFSVPDLCFFLKVGLRTWGTHKDVIDISSVIEIEINTNRWGVAYDTPDFKDAVIAYKNAYKYIDEGDFIKSVQGFKTAEKLAPQLKFPYVTICKKNLINHENLSFLNLKNEFENAWAISEQLYFTILDILPVGSTILELGSGTGTRELCKYYKVISIEHNPDWLNKSGAEYIYAPLIDDYWYNPAIIARALENRSYDLLLIDGPPQFRRAGVVDNFDLFKQNIPIIFDDVSRNEDAYAMNRLAEKLDKKPKIYMMGIKGFALIL